MGRAAVAGMSMAYDHRVPRALSPHPHALLQTVVLDARGHMLGRLASIVAKQLLSGQHIVSFAA